MKKEVYYTYLGSNGTITTSVFLEGIYNVKKYLLVADKNKMLTKDGKHFVKTTLIPAAEVDQWSEVDK